jgi:hypothetical protein
VTKDLIEEAMVRLLAKEIGSFVHRRAMTAALERADAFARANTRTIEQVMRDVDQLEARRLRLVSAIEAGTITNADARERMELIRRERARLFAERDTVAVQPTATAREREQLVTEALDFASTAKILRGPALRELIQRWVGRAEFNTSDRGLTVEPEPFQRSPVAFLLKRRARDSNPQVLSDAGFQDRCISHSASPPTGDNYQI